MQIFPMEFKECLMYMGLAKTLETKSLGMLNIFLTMARQEKKVLVKGSLDRFRDFIFIDDVAEIWKRVILSEKSMIVNVGTGRSLTSMN